MALVLCTGVDPSLIATRKLILELAGHTVVAAMNELQISAACDKHLFEVAVIGQTVSPNTKRMLASVIRSQSPSTKILELYPPYQGRVLENADSWLEVPVVVPRDLADRVSELAEKERQQR